MAISEWSLAGALEELKNIHISMKNRSLVFIIGAGASRNSEIPTGRDFAQRWLRELHNRECLSNIDLDTWLKQNSLGIEGLTFSGAAEFYPEIFERRFRGDYESGYAQLALAMDGKIPSLGYSFLAKIIQGTRHNAVVTTNFDNMVVDALAMQGYRSPIVVGHENLASFARPQPDHPLVAKIHRDLFLEPKNDHVGVDTMEQEWQNVLGTLFQKYTPIVVGYGGNDGSLMGFLRQLPKGKITGRMMWCCIEGSEPSSAAEAVLNLHDGVLVKITDFDDFMLQLARVLVDDFDMAKVVEGPIELSQENLARRRKHAGELLQSGAKAWKLRADAEQDLQRRAEIYVDGLKQYPYSAYLHHCYAGFLGAQQQNYEAAKAMYEKALELDRSDAGLTGDFANFLAYALQDYAAADAMYEKALELDPLAAGLTGDYANFLADELEDYVAADTMYKKAIELDPSNSEILRLYAYFLAYQHKDYDAADAMYIKALEIDPSNYLITQCYQEFLDFRLNEFVG